LESSLSLDIVPESNKGGSMVTKKTTGQNFPRANRSPRGEYNVPAQKGFARK